MKEELSAMSSKRKVKGTIHFVGRGAREVVLEFNGKDARKRKGHIKAVINLRNKRTKAPRRFNWESTFKIIYLLRGGPPRCSRGGGRKIISYLHSGGGGEESIR